MNLKIEVSLSSLLHYAAIVGFGFTLGILGAAEVVWYCGRWCRRRKDCCEVIA